MAEIRINQDDWIGLSDEVQGRIKAILAQQAKMSGMGVPEIVADPEAPAVVEVLRQIKEETKETLRQVRLKKRG